MSRPSSAALLLLSLVVACAGSHDEDSGDWGDLPPLNHIDPELAPLGIRDTTLTRVCSRGHADAFSAALCSEAGRPEIRGMAELLELVDLTEDRAFALTGNSTSLVARSVSAINPRIIVFPRVEPDLQPLDTMTAVGFVRGEQFVEIVSRDLQTGEPNFYLLSFEQACNYGDADCDLASLLTEELEHEWTAYSVYDHEDLEPTSFDCLSCHQTGQYGSSRMLRMQELTSPWLHWFPQRFGQRTDSDRALVQQFADAHQTEEEYGGIPVNTILTAIDEGSGAQLEALVRSEGDQNQPNPFDGQIVSELANGQSVTWDARFAVHLDGQAIALPYPGIDVTDAALRTTAVNSYVEVVTGSAPRETLLDIREVFSQDAKERSSFVSLPGADGETVLRQMCARCHDGRGNPDSNKARFDVLRLDEMSRQEKDLAIARLTATDRSILMPPWRVGALSPDALEAAISALRQ